MHISAMALLEAENLRIHIRSETGLSRAVDGVTFTVEPGEALALVGESGCGKSLTALGVMGLLPPAAFYADGALRFEGRDILALSEKKRRALRGREMAMVFQDPMQYLNPVLTCGEQVAEPMRVLAEASRRIANERVHELFREVGLPDPERQAGQYPHELSGGMRQRVLISMALALHPKMLIADEPTTALDATVQAQILLLLRRLAREKNMALLFITHDLSAVSQIADRVAVMYAGKIVETFPVERLFRGARHPYTRALLASMPARTPAGEPLRGIPGHVPDPKNPPTACRFHPRCTRALSICSQVEPLLENGLACHNPWPDLPHALEFTASGLETNRS
jgi:oligopeptide/dipeptide ABC transporter ATP-binding protein